MVYLTSDWGVELFKEQEMKEILERESPRVLLVLRGLARVAGRELVEDSMGVGDSEGRLALVLDQKAPELVDGHPVPALRVLGEHRLDVGRRAGLAGLELPVEALEHLVIVVRCIAVPHRKFPPPSPTDLRFGFLSFLFGHRESESRKKREKREREEVMKQERGP